MTKKTGIEFDKSDTEVLLVCHDCGGTWRAFAWTLAEAEKSAQAHEERAHPGYTGGIRQRLDKRHAKRRERAAKR
ncbi:hypothetical protein FB468_2065 [Leucobacter komagatae]|uniref:Uncharacterized protein n=1 Tax=Leucobacter komagatae TaxID=55969 RepID=A0A542Y7P0_9MICO|nr:hypothetical protein [Leucobacter komagatae]TQL44027.1 hypothetical protein FB468_2065 [Leucobacter komagatae]